MEKVCIVCGKTFKTWPSYVKRGVVCCSRDCQTVQQRKNADPARFKRMSEKGLASRWGKRKEEQACVGTD